MTPGRDAFFCSFSRCKRSTTFFVMRTRSLIKNGLVMKSSTPSTSGLRRSSMSGRLAMNKNGMCRVDSRPQFLEELPAVQAGHFVITENHIGGRIDDLQEGIRAVRGGLHLAERL